MKSLFKKFVILLCVVVSLLSFTACGAQMDYAYSSDGEYGLYDLTVKLDNALLREMEKTASKKATGEKWTFSEWIDGFTKHITFSDGTAFAFKKEGEKDGRYYIQFTRKVKLNNDGGGNTDPNYSFVKKNRGYLYELTVTMSNPFNDMRTEFDEAQPTKVSLMSMIKYGIVTMDWFGDLNIIYPSVFDAFPAIKDKDVGAFQLNFLMPATKNEHSTGVKEERDGQLYFRFERNFDTNEEIISYRYFRANSLTWNLTIIGIGILAVALILVLTSLGKKNKQDKNLILKEKFPYDPDDGAQEDNLPSDYNDRDPFRY